VKVRDSDVLAWVRGQRKMSQVLGAFGLLDFTIFRPVLAWRTDNCNRGHRISEYGGTAVYCYDINCAFVGDNKK
jgi:hypothetical protein